VRESRLLILALIPHPQHFNGTLQHCSSPFHHDREETKDLLSCRDRLQHTKTSIPIFSRDQDMLILMIGTFKNCGKREMEELCVPVTVSDLAPSPNWRLRLAAPPFWTRCWDRSSIMHLVNFNTYASTTTAVFVSPSKP